MTKSDDNKNAELDRIEDKLIRDEAESKKAEMPVSGKSVFEIKRMKGKKTGRDDK